MEKRKVQQIVDMLKPASEQDDVIKDLTIEVNEDQILSQEDLIEYEDLFPPFNKNLEQLD